MSQEVGTYAFGGGLDTNSAALAFAPGAVLASENYEPLAEGYGRMQGYERFDGQSAPSAATFWTIEFNTGSVALTTGQTVTGAVSGATGVVIAAPAVDSGSWDSGDAAGAIAFTDLSGHFTVGEVLSGPSGPCAIAAQTEATENADRLEQYDTWLGAAQDWWRGHIDAVPGVGPVRGVAVHHGQIYAWRDSAVGGFCLGFKATSGGWVALPVLSRITFGTGSVEVFPGDTINGATSGATARIRRIVNPAGDWGASTAEGWIDLDTITGTFVSGEVLRIGTSPWAGTTSGAALVRLPAGGRVRGVSHNFYGASDRYRYYGTTGAGPAFEMLEDGALCTIATGMADDRPQRAFVIANHLGLVYPGGSVQFSGTGEPLQWQVILGAGEIGFGSDVTDVVQSNQTAVAIFGENKVGVLQGADAASFALDILTEEAGSIADSAQRIGSTVYVDARGMRNLEATQAFGNFKTGAASGRFERYFRVQRSSGATIIGSFVCRTKSQYRLIWSDGTGLSVRIGGKTPEALQFTFGDMRPHCFATGEVADGEAMLVGGEDGYVYRLDRGNTFDGAQLSAFLLTPFNHFGNPIQQDRFHKVVLEMVSPPRCSIGVLADFDYGEGMTPDSGPHSLEVYGGGGYWNAINWNDFYWSSPVYGRAEFYIDGFGRNASFTFVSTPAAGEDPHILQAYQVYRSRRKTRL